MYCDCLIKRPLTNDAAGSVFTVCAKSKGGCGKEIVSKSTPGSYLKVEDIDFGGVSYNAYGGIPKGEKICPECEGGCFTMVCYGGMPIEKNCDYCDGRGTVEDDDE